MNLKRPATHESDAEYLFPMSSPRKRPKSEPAFFPETPVASSSKIKLQKTMFATPKTPFTPFPLKPSDSPSNPFGRKRAAIITLKLPPPTSFSKHAAFRFQFVRDDVSAQDDGVYRVVRVPLNYTFSHLRCLIAWLFHMPASHTSTMAGALKDYLFEIKNDISLMSGKYGQGRIKSGSTFVKLSNVRDPARWRSGYGFGDDEDEMVSELEEELSREDNMIDGDSDVATEDEGNDEDWKWADEEDFTLEHAFPQGIVEGVGILYHYSPTTQVHITVNRGVTPRMKGTDNKPGVITARGRAFLSPPLPQPIFSNTAQDIMSSSPVRTYLRPMTKFKANLDSSSPFLSFSRMNQETLRKRSPLKKSIKAHKDEELTDNDAEWDADIDPHEMQEFNPSHPFFLTESSSPIKPTKHVDEREIIYVEDSDDAISQEDEDDFFKEDLSIHINPNKWNEAREPFGHYLLRYMDPEGNYDDLDESFFEEPKSFDPFDIDDDPIPETEPVEGDDQHDQYGDECEEDEIILDDNSETTSEKGEASEDEEYEYGEEYEEDSQSYYDENEPSLRKDFQAGGPTYANPPRTQISTPGLTNRTSSASSLPPSSPLRSSSPATLEFYFPNSSSYSLPDPADFGHIIDTHYPNKKYSKTPAPPKTKKFRLRIKRLEKRLAKIKKTKYITAYDEDQVEEREQEAEKNQVCKENAGPVKSKKVPKIVKSPLERDKKFLEGK